MTISNISKATGSVVNKFHKWPPRTEGMKNWSNCPSNITIMAAKSVYGKTFKYLLLQNQIKDGLET